MAMLKNTSFHKPVLFEKEFFWNKFIAQRQILLPFNFVLQFGNIFKRIVSAILFFVY
jgi:hypothetical protein